MTDERLLSPFIVGVGRSGTTLLRMMLDAHPDFAIPAETHFLRNTGAGPADARQHFLSLLQAGGRRNDFPISDAALRDALGDAPLPLADCVRRFYALYAAQQGKPRWGDKTPIYVAVMSDISALLPEAAFIHMIRDGRDVAVSSRSAWFSAGVDVLEHAKTWSGRIRSARRQAQTLPHYLEVRYEHLLIEPERELTRICDFLGVRYAPEMLDYPQRARERLMELQAFGQVSAQHRRDMHSRTERAPDAARIGRWKQDLTPEQRAAYESVARDLLIELGYET